MLSKSSKMLHERLRSVATMQQTTRLSSIKLVRDKSPSPKIQTPKKSQQENPNAHRAADFCDLDLWRLGFLMGRRQIVTNK
jgi:hypothetical protein